MTNVNQAPLPRLSKRRWYVLRLLSGAISSTWLYLFLPYLDVKAGKTNDIIVQAVIDYYRATHMHSAVYAVV